MPRLKKLTPSVKKQILTAIRSGTYQQDAAALVGVDRRTLNRWLNDGKDPESEYHKFYLDFQGALAEAKEKQIRGIQKGDSVVEIIKDSEGKIIQKRFRRHKKTGDLKWLLAKRFPEQFGDGLDRMLELFEEKYGSEFGVLLQELIDAAEAAQTPETEYEEDELRGDSEETQ